jgi:lipopolysaccharide/colanic/teichoic acid biosynthesis glycosyltransferase
MENYQGAYIGPDPKIAQNLSKQTEHADLQCYRNTLNFIQSIKNSKANWELIVYDYQPGEMEPEVLAQMVRNNATFKNGVFILFDQLTNKEKNQKYLKNGIDDVFTFPADYASIASRIEFIRKLNRKENQYRKKDFFEYKLPLSKRLFDLFFASLALLFLSPLMLITALLIRLESRGSVFYISKRVGTGYKVFDFYKFRSMKLNADTQIHDLKKENQYAQNSEETEVQTHPAEKNKENLAGVPLFSDDGIVCEKEFLQSKNKESQTAFVKIHRDPRITRVGRFIRNTSIDELPQLINIIKGDMSIVGNRPLPLYEAEQITSDRLIERFIAPAGLTGLWQVEKRAKSSQMSPEERKALDIEYARTFNFWRDLKLILRTFTALFQSEDV